MSNDARGVAYVDSSCVVAIALGEPSASRMALRLRTFNRLISNVLLEADVRAACIRERAQVPDAELALIHFVPVRRRVGKEINLVLSAGYLRGADCLHVATALVFSPEAPQLTFLTLDERQREVAKALGFGV